MPNLFNASSQEPDSDLSDLELKEYYLVKMLGNGKFDVFRAALSKQFPEHPALSESIEQYLKGLLDANDVQSLELLSLKEPTSLIQSAIEELSSAA